MNASTAKGMTLGAALGLIVGYVAFGHVNGHLVPIGHLLFAPQGVLENVAYWALGLGEIRRWVLMSALVGAGIGAVVQITRGLAAGLPRSSVEVTERRRGNPKASRSTRR
jgi:hypothetical protein